MVCTAFVSHAWQTQNSSEQSQCTENLARSRSSSGVTANGTFDRLKALAMLFLAFNVHNSELGLSPSMRSAALRLPSWSRSIDIRAVATVEGARGAFKIQEQSKGKAELKGRQDTLTREARVLEARLLKRMRETCLNYEMIEGGDHIMVCVSGGKDSATLLHLFLQLHAQLHWKVPFTLTAVHLNQHQPGYNNTALVAWLNKLGVAYQIVSEDTYSIVKDKTPESKAYCSLCSRLRRGILYSVAQQIGATKIALGHHADDAAETLFLNMIHQGQLKGMPARYYSHTRDAHVMRPLISCLEQDIATFATEMKFPILPCNLCGSQPDLQRGQVKLLLSTLETLTSNAKANLINAMSSVRPSHLLDQPLRNSSGFDPITGQVRHPRAKAIQGYDAEPVSPYDDVDARDWVDDDPLLLL